VLGGWPFPHVVAALSDQPQDGIRAEAVDLSEIRPEQGVQRGPRVELRLLTQFFIHSSETPRRKMPTAPMAALGSDYISCSRLPWLMGATPLCVLNRERPCSSCACLAVLRTYRHKLCPGGQL